MSLLKDIIAAIMKSLGSVGAMTQVELETALDKLSRDSTERLDWRNSIVDLLKLTRQDSSLQARERLAAELGYQGHFNGDPQMNMWLHEQVMRSLAEHRSALPT